MNKEKRVPGASIRNFWHIKPITRIHDNDFRKSPKKQRQMSRKAVSKTLNELERDN